MKKLLFIASYLLLFTYCKSQNLVPNSSFETITSCPNNGGQVYHAPPWFQPCIHYGDVLISSSSDLFDTCANFVECVPSNSAGFQYAKTGHAYIGVIPYADTADYREYIEVQLDSALRANKKYCVQFYVSLSYIGIAISDFGAYFSVDSLLDTTNYKTINVIPQIENPSANYLSDTANWMLVSGSFIATGGERFMTIGNFNLPSNTHVQNLGGTPYSYYYIDDISVVDCTGVGIDEVAEKNRHFKLYPNPNDGNMILEYKLNTTESGLIVIYDVSGRLVKQQTINSENTSLIISATELNAGVYYYEIKVGDKRVKTEKLIIIK